MSKDEIIIYTSKDGKTEIAFTKLSEFSVVKNYLKTAQAI